MINQFESTISFLDELAKTGHTEKKAFTPFPDQALPPLLIDPQSGQPYVVDPETNQPSPATPEMLMEMGIDPAQLGMAPPQAGPQAGAPPPGAMPPQGGPPPAGGPPQEGGSPEEILGQFDQRIGNLEAAMDQLMQIIEQSQPPPAPGRGGPTPPQMGGMAPAGPQMAQAPQMGV